MSLAQRSQGFHARAWLSERALRAPQAELYRYIHGDGRPEQAFSAADLDRQARQISSWLRRQGEPGERVLLAHGPGPEFLAGFFGCLGAGMIAVPAYPPKQTRHGIRLQAVLKDCGARLALADAAGAAALRQLGKEKGPWAQLTVLEQGAELPPAGLQDPDRPLPAPGGLAYLQYTSGSTADPKGVMVTHASLAHNLELMRQAFDGGPDMVMVSWLPLFHDMGLVLGALLPLYCGGRCVLMAPNAFIQQPRLWLDALSRLGGTHSAAPDFAYRHCADKIPSEQIQGLDLRRWRVAVNGAEPVREATLRRFSAAFAGAGFSAEAFRPAYGLAEGTLYVSSGGWDGLAGGVPCGHALGQDLRIVDPQTLQPCASGETGEIWVRGGSICAGYWQRPELSAAVFQARLADGEGPYLRTGDLGRDSGGALLVQGRLKDLVILRGVNHHPEDMEETARQAAGPGAAAAAAFAHQGPDGERLVLVQELPRARKDEAVAVAERIAEALAQDHGVEAEHIVVVGPGQVPRTSSGKVQRRACQRDWLDGALRIWHERVQGAAQFGPAAPLDSLRQAERQAFDSAQKRMLLQEPVSSPAPAHDWVPGVAQALPATGGPSGPAGGSSQPAPETMIAWRERAHPALEALWSAVSAAPANSAYHIAWSLQLPQAPDLHALQRALQGLVQAQPRLGSAFSVDASGGLWSQARGLTPSVERPEGSFNDSAAQSWLARWNEQPFDLQGAPLWRCAALTLADGSALLAFCFHHLIFDQRSWEAFHEFLADPKARSWAVPPPALCAGEDATASRAYWRQALAAARPGRLIAQPQGRGASMSAQVPPALVEALKRAAARQRVTAFVAVAAAWGDALAAVSRSPQALFAIPSTLRAQPLSDAHLGYFVQPMPLLLGRLQGDPAQALARADTALQGSLRHRGLTLGAALRQGALGLPEAFLVYQGELPETLPVLGQRARLRPIPNAALKAPLALEVGGARGWDLLLSYDQALGEPQAAALLQAFQQALGRIAGAAEPAATRPAIVRSEGALPGHSRSVVDAFHAQVGKRSGAQALRWDSGGLSYGELAERVRSVARAIDQAGVVPGQRVAVLAEPGPDWAAALLGCFEAGVVYMPLDPAYPQERLRAMLKAAPCALALVDGPPPDCLKGVPALQLDAAVHARPPYLRAPGRPAPQDPAYVIFTSGSSGVPKGVQVSHGALLNHAEGYAARLGLGEGDRALQFVSVSFDPSLEELLPALLSGACVVLSRRRGALGVHELESLARAQAVSVLHLPAAYWHAWMAAGGADALARLPELRALVTGGEAPDPHWVQTLLRATAGRCRYYNAYGPTEACISVSLHECADAATLPPRLPLGRPLPGMTLAVVGPDGRLACGEQEGELWISGPQLADGHWIDGRLDTQAFCIADLEGGDARRWYRSGDRVQWLAGQGLLHRGRMDRQVKIAGHRLDPEEVEQLLLEGPGVAQAAVDLRQRAGREELLAWVVSAPGASADPPRLRERLAQRLPAACMPARIHVVAALPLTPNGKVDRAALQDAGAADAGAAADEGPLAELGRLWAACLGLPHCGADADFFELGGSSLSAVRLAAEAGRACGRAVDVDLLLRAGTPRRLLQALGGEGPAPQALQDLGGRGTAQWVLFPPVSGRLDCYRPLAAALGESARVHGFDLSALGAQGPQRWSQWVRACSEQILAAFPQGPLALGGWSMGGLLAADVALALVARGRPVQRLALIDSQLPDPVESALLRDDPELLDPVFDRDLAALRGGGAPDAGPWRERFKDHALALAEFQPRPLPIPVSLIISERSARERPQASWMGWALLAKDGMTTRQLPGDHYAVMDAAAAARVGRGLNRDAGEGFQAQAPAPFAQRGA